MSQQWPLVDSALGLRFMRAERDVMLDWLQGLQQLPGNPYGVEIRQFGNATALVTRALAEAPLYNRVMCLGEEEEGCLVEIKAFYADQGVRCCLDLNPFHVTPKLLLALAQLGFYQADFHMILYNMPRLDLPDLAPGLTIRELRVDELETFVAIYEQGFGNGELARVLYGRPGWHLYVALLDGAYAAINTTYIKDGIASSVDTTTLPTMRGSGCQQALSYYRLKTYVAEGSPILITQAVAAGITQSNWQRCGGRIACNHVWWMAK